MDRFALPIRYLAGSVAARLAEEGMSIELALLAADRTGDVRTAGVLLAGWLAPHILVAPAVGALAARAHRPARWYAIGLLGYAAAITGTVTLLGRAPLPLVTLIAVCGGACGPVVSGGLSGMVAALTPEPHQARAYSLDAAGYNLASVAGPALVALAASTVDPATAGYLLAGFAAIGAAAIGSLPVSLTPSTGAPWRRELVRGAAVLWRRPELRAITIAGTLATGGLGALSITAVGYASDWGRATDAGLLTTAFAAGALTGALLTAWRPPSMSATRLAAVSLLLTTVALAMAATRTEPVWGIVWFAVAGAGDGPLLSATLRLRAAHTPPQWRGQVFTTGAAVKITAAALGAGIAGAVEVSGPAGLLGIAACQLAGCAALLVTRRGGRAQSRRRLV